MTLSTVILNHPSRARIVGHVTGENKKAITIAGTYGPVIVPMAWVERVEHDEEGN